MIESIPTPFLCIDAEIVDRNLRAMASYCEQHSIGLRPHIKTHKTKYFADSQLALGAIGITSAKPSEAESVATDRCEILIAYPTFSKQGLNTLCSLCTEHRVLISIDSFEAASAISDFAVRASIDFGLLIDIDVGHHRTGILDEQEVAALAQKIERLPSVAYEGVLFFPGHIVPSRMLVEDGMSKLRHSLVQSLEALKSVGLPAKIVSGGSTPTARYSHLVPEITEIRPGTYLFNDLNSVQWKCARIEDCAAVVHATIVSTAVKGKAIMDAGSKMLSSDLCGADPTIGFGQVLDHAGTIIARLSEEHGEIELGQSDWSPKIGERVRIIPNHICPCVNLQNEVILQDQDAFRRIAVDGRGKMI